MRILFRAAISALLVWLAIGSASAQSPKWDRHDGKPGQNGYTKEQKLDQRHDHERDKARAKAIRVDDKYDREREKLRDHATHHYSKTDEKRRKELAKEREKSRKHTNRSWKKHHGHQYGRH